MRVHNICFFRGEIKDYLRIILNTPSYLELRENMTLMELQQDLIGLGQGQASPDKVEKNQATWTKDNSPQ